jgi:F-type H+-transporting ATPase subunit b
MLIDWFTVCAQALNFLILVWMMKHFLYKPILDAIDTREKRIASELADANTKKAEAQKDRDEFQHKNEEFDKQRATLMTKATDEAKATRQRLLDDARKAADVLSAKRQDALKTEAHNLDQAISRWTQQRVFSIARKALTDLATTSLEERMGEVFTRRLRELNGKAKETVANALKRESDPALIRSTFDIPAEQRAAIQNALNETFSAEVHVKFETAPELVSGIELLTNGEKVGWTIADYLTSMQKGVSELIDKQASPVLKAPSALAPEPASEPKAAPTPAPNGVQAPAPTPAPAAKTAPAPAPKPASEPKAAPAPTPAPEPKTAPPDAAPAPAQEAK